MDLLQEWGSGTSSASSIVFSPPSKLWWGDFLVLKKFFEGSWHFLHFKGGESTWGACQNSLLRGDSTFKNGILYLFFHVLNLARWYSCTILTVLSYIIIRIPDFGVGTTIMLSCRYLPKVVQVKLWALAWKWWIVR